MPLSKKSISKISEALAEDFSCFLHTEYQQQFSELLADAATEFVERELGEVDDELFYDLACQLVGSIYIAINK